MQVTKSTTLIETAQKKRIRSILLDSQLSHLIQKIEGDNKEVTFVRVDSDHIDNLIKKDETTISKLSDEEKKP
jgi:molecular chaperone HtpG